jgi:hypothetical protein
MNLYKIVNQIYNIRINLRDVCTPRSHHCGHQRTDGEMAKRETGKLGITDPVLSRSEQIRRLRFQRRDY